MTDRIETFQDLLKLLDSKPEWVEELRTRILPAELIALPALVAEFVASTNKRFEALDRDVAELKSDVAELKADVAELKAGQERMEARQDRMESRQDRMENDIGQIKGQITPITARRMVGKIAEVTQSRRPRWLADTDIIDIADDADTANVPYNELESFRAIDLVLRAIDKSGADSAEHYVIIECSSTVDANDVERARRNAAYMTQFTGQPTRAVVIGNQVPVEVERLADQMSVACITITNKSARPR